MKQWHRLLKQVLKYGEKREDRTGTGTISVFGTNCRFDLRAGFPAITTKRLGFAQVSAELAAFLAGAETLGLFHALGCTIWDANAQHTSGSTFMPRFEGDLGRIYGVQWRRWRSWKKAMWAADEPAAHPDDVVTSETDQLAELVKRLQTDPFSRRHLVTAWNPGELSEVCLPACHVMFQCYVSADKQFLDLRFDMRSCDLFLGLPFDIASYALLMHLLAADAGLIPRWLSISIGDAHIYLNHLDQAHEALSRALRPLPQLALSGRISVLEFLPEQASLVNYDPHPTIAAKMNV